MTFVTIPLSDVAEGKPGKELLLRNMRDNIAAIANGDAGAPTIRTSALAIKTVTIAGSMNKSDKLQITMNAYAFFPSLYAPVSTAGFPVIIVAAAQVLGGVDSPRFSLGAANFVADTGPFPYTVKYQYIDDEFISQPFSTLPDSFLTAGVVPPNSTILSLSQNPRGWADGHANAPKIKRKALSIGTNSISGSGTAQVSGFNNIVMRDYSFFPMMRSVIPGLQSSLFSPTMYCNTATPSGDDSKFCIAQFLRKPPTIGDLPYTFTVRYSYLNKPAAGATAYITPPLTISNDPVTIELSKIWRSNPIAIAEDGPGAPPISSASLRTSTQTVSATFASNQEFTVDIKSNKAAFFPMIYATRIGGGVSPAGPINPGSIDYGTADTSSFRLSLVNHFTVRYRYLTD